MSSKGQGSSSHLIGLGRISGAQGIRGAVKVRPDARAATTDPADFLALGEVVIGGREYSILQADRLKNQVVLQLAGIDTRSRAEELAGQEVQGDRRRFPRLPPGEYYWFQLLGLPVYDVGDGSLLGHLQEILPTPGHDVYVVVQGSREILLPAVEEVILEINLDEDFIRVAPPQGLLEAYAD
ncbi:MAG: ribosome maturation factor RimM [Deltaproteobacteria bacterium]|nr:ribosome maturation factor RimM [Deltaproteobacteria bacterium]